MMVGSTRQWSGIWALCLGGLLAGAGCQEPSLQNRPATREGETFGAKFFTIACQRVAYTSSLRAQRADPQRPIDVSGSRYRLACRYGPQFLSVEQARKEDPKVSVFFDNRNDFIGAIDLIFPGNELADLQQYMVNVLDLTDSGLFPKVVEKTAAAIDVTQVDPAFNAALARIAGRLGYRPRSVGLGILREALSYPKLQELLENTLELVSEGGKGHAAFEKLIAALAFQLRSARRVDDPATGAPMHPGSTERTLKLALDLLLKTDPAFGSGSSRWLVARDWRGLARVRHTAGGVSAPFVDKDQDGLADADGFGNFVTAGGKAPAPFHYDPTKPDAAAARDIHGRAVDSAGKLVYDYLDLDSTLLGALSRDALSLLDPARDTLLKMLQGMTAVLGERRTQTRKGLTAGDDLSYQGFDSKNSPLLDLAYALLSLLRDPAFLSTFDGLKILLNGYEAEVARLVAAGRRAFDIAGKYPARKVDPKSTVFDELLVLSRQMVNTPGLTEDLLTALADPRSKNVDRMLVNYFRFADVHVLGPGDKVVSQTGGPKLFSRPVARDKADTGSNRSIQQRLFHVIHDTNGMVMCNKDGAKISIPIICDLPLIKNTSLCTKTYKACELFEVKNGAVFYLMSIARRRDAKGKLTNIGKAYLRLKTENMPTLIAAAVDSLGADLVLRTMTGIDGMGEHPTTRALNRLMFMEKMPPMLAAAQDFPADIDGEPIHQAHKGSLFSWEIVHPGMSCSANDPCVFYDAFRPVAQAFADHDQAKLLVDILSVLHRHWSSKGSGDYQYKDPKGANFSQGSNLVSYEAAVAEILQTGDLYGALRAFVGVANGLKLGDGSKFKDTLTRTARYLLDPTASPELTDRNGGTKSLWSDGVTEVEGGISPIYLLADAFQRIDAALARAQKPVADAWKDAVTDLVDIFLGTEPYTDAKLGIRTRFGNRRIVPAATVLLDFLRARVARHSPICKSSQQCVGGGICLASGRCTTRHINDDLAAWAGQRLPADLESSLAGPVVAAAADFVHVLRQDPKAKNTLRELLRYLIDEINNNQGFSATLTGIGDLLQLLLDDADLVPIGRAIGRVLAPEHGLIETLLAFLKPAMARDDKGALTRILKNAVKEQSPGTSPAETLLEMSKEMHREAPGARLEGPAGAGTNAPYTAADYKNAIWEIRDFLANQQTGLIKFFEIIQNRCGGPCAPATGK